MIASPEKLELGPECGLEAVESKSILIPERKPIASSNEEPADENLYLIGRPTLKQFLRFARSNAVHPPSEGTLTDEWQAAYDVARVLEKDEAGAADNPGITPLEL